MASKRYNSYVLSRTKEMQKLLEKEIEEIVEQIAKDTVKKLKVFVEQYWYRTYVPTQYNRTYSLLDAIDYEISGNIASIYLNEDMLVHDFREENWNAHMSFDGEDFGEEIMYFIENGVYPSGKYGSFHNPRIGDGSGAIQKTINWLNRYLRRTVSKELALRFNTGQSFHL